MPIPLAVPIVGSIFAALGPWVMRFFAAKAVIMAAGFMGRVGLVLATNEVIMEPLIDMVTTKWATLPASMQCWMGTFGVIKAASVLVSGMTLIAAKSVFFQKSS